MHLVKVMYFNESVTVITAAECQLLTESDHVNQIIHKEKAISSVSSGTGLVTSSSDSGCKFTSSAIPGVRNIVSIFYHSYSLCLM
jgi:hypothetical protein